MINNPNNQFSSRDSLKAVVSLLPLEWSLGPSYWRNRLLIKRAKKWDRDQLDEWKFIKLRNLLYTAYNFTSGYKDLYVAHGIHPSDFRCLSDLNYFPIVTRQILSANIDAFTLANKADAYMQKTSGTSGTPFMFWQQRRNFTESSFIHDTWKKFGHSPNKLAVVLKGGFGSHNQESIRFSSYERSLFLSTPLLSKDTIKAYVNEIKLRKINILRALPSSLNVFCDLLGTISKETWPQFKMVSLSSEMLTVPHLEKFRFYFPDAEIFSWYGHSEHAVFASQCTKSRVYHPNELYGFTEVLKEDLSAQENNMDGLIVGTSYWASPTLFIRYMTDDVATVGPSHCAYCGQRGQTLNQIKGRSSDYFIGKDGVKISATVMNLQDDTYDGVLEFQFYQETPGEVKFSFVESFDSKSVDLVKLESNIKSKLGPSFTLKIVKVLNIERPASGKLKIIHQCLKV